MSRFAWQNLPQGTPLAISRTQFPPVKLNLRSLSRLGISFVNLRVLRGTRIFLALIIGVSFVSSPSLGRIRPHRTQSAPDAEYVSALAVANKFLYAWQTHDEESGLLLLTDAVKKSSTEDNIAAFFTSAPITTYEIGRGKKLKPGLYSFPLALYNSRLGNEKICPRRYSQLNVIRTGKEDWAIDKLP